MIWNLTLLGMFIFGWDFEVDTCSKFWRRNLITICVRTCNMNSTLGSVVSLAMFFLLVNKFCGYIFMPPSLLHYFLIWFDFCTFALFRWISNFLIGGQQSKMASDWSIRNFVDMLFPLFLSSPLFSHLIWFLNFHFLPVDF